MKMDDLGVYRYILYHYFRKHPHRGHGHLRVFYVALLCWKRWRHNDFPLDQVAVSYSEATSCELFLGGPDGLPT